MEFHFIYIFGTLGTVFRRFTHEAPTRIVMAQGREFPKQVSGALHAKRRKKISDQVGTKEVFIAIYWRSAKYSISHQQIPAFGRVYPSFCPE